VFLYFLHATKLVWLRLFKCVKKDPLVKVWSGDIQSCGQVTYALFLWIIKLVRAVGEIHRLVMMSHDGKENQTNNNKPKRNLLIYKNSLSSIADPNWKNEDGRLRRTFNSHITTVGSPSVSSALQGCIYLIKNKNSNIITILNSCFLCEYTV